LFGYSGPGFLKWGTIDTFHQIILGYAGAVLGIVGCLAASLASTH